MLEKIDILEKQKTIIPKKLLRNSESKLKVSEILFNFL